MATGPRLVNKQFNTPIGLYSQRNIQDTLSKQSQLLNNGAVGIDFNNPVNSKPANLANSAVLRMLEEEEQRQRSGQAARRGDGRSDPSVRRIDRFIDWPPKNHREGDPRDRAPYSAKFFTPRNSGTKRVAWPPPAEEGDEQEIAQSAPAQRQAPHSQVPSYSSPAVPAPALQSPALTRLVPDRREHAPPQAKIYSPVPPGRQQEPSSPQRAPPGPVTRFIPVQREPLSPQTPPTQTFPPPFPATGYAPVSPSAAPRSPLSPLQTFSPPVQAFSPSVQAFSPSVQAFSPPVQTFPPPQQSAFGPVVPRSLAPQQAPPSPRWAPVSPTGLVAPVQPQFVEPPPSIIALRPAAPIHQLPPPVVTSQPATNTFRGGVNMRGDQKWPPETVKQAVEAENDARVSLAKGPACRPRKVKKDYSRFFAQNALPHNYPGYRAPPGTQHFDDNGGESQF